jgi:hypothetical protein
MGDNTATKTSSDTVDLPGPIRFRHFDVIIRSHILIHGVDPTVKQYASTSTVCVTGGTCTSDLVIVFVLDY